MPDLLLAANRSSRRAFQAPVSGQARPLPVTLSHLLGNPAWLARTWSSRHVIAPGLSQAHIPAVIRRGCAVAVSARRACTRAGDLGATGDFPPPRSHAENSASATTYKNAD
jgi:hypothetical protein